MHSRMKLISLVLLLGVTSLVVAQFSTNGDQQSAQYTQTDPRFDSQISNLISNHVLQFAQEIGKNLLKDSTSKAEIFSPLSIWGAVSLLFLGAGGRTHRELMENLKFSNDAYLNSNPWKIHEEFGLLIEDVAAIFSNPKHRRPQAKWKINQTQNSFDRNTIDQRISVANGLFVQNGYSIRDDYRNAVLNTYKSTIFNLDFSADAKGSSEFINRWVSEKTMGKIRSIVTDEINADTKVIIASALYFKALWEKTFIDGATGKRNFYPDGVDNDPITVNMMAHGGVFPYYDAKEYDCRILAIPYKHNLTTMYVILPNNSNRQRLRDLQATLTADIIDYLITKMEWKTTVLLLPKMHITNQINLKRVFQKLGLTTLFDSHQSDFSLISSGAEVTPNQNKPNLPSPFAGSTSVPNNGDRIHSSKPVHLFPILEPGMRFPGDEADNDDSKFVFSRIGEDEPVSTSNSTNITINAKLSDVPSADSAGDKNQQRNKRSTLRFKTESEFRQDDDPPRLKDYILNKRLSKPHPFKKYRNRVRRQTPFNFDPTTNLKNIDQLRQSVGLNGIRNPGLFIDDIVHKVDLNINEQGTEGAASTITYLSRTGTDVVFRVDTPFMILIRHEDTKLPLFYGTIYEPTEF